jgi:hypothetical protein
MERYSFDSYKPTTDSQERALGVARRVVEIAKSGTTDPAMVVLSGGPGVGKTHLIEAIRYGLSASGLKYDYFSGHVPYEPKGGLPIVVGDDAFSQFDRLGGKVIDPSSAEVGALNNAVLNTWYPESSLVVMSSNFSLQAIQTALSEFDTIGRASSRLQEMAQRGADIRIEADDHRTSGLIQSIF